MGDKIQILLLNEQEVAGLLAMDEVMKGVEQAFREKATGHAQMPPKTYIKYKKYNGDLRTMPAYMENLDVSSVKIVNAHPDNPTKFGLPTVSATILLIEPKNGQPLAMLGGRNITAMRTGAAGGIAAKYLSPKNPKTASLIGTGVQSRSQLLALYSVFPSLSKVNAWDISPAAANALIAETNTKMPRLETASLKTVKEAVEDADIIVTTTPSIEPIVLNSWVPDGTHFNCIGPDAPGKEELDPAILKRSKIIVDDWEQASHSGEINVPLSRGEISKKDIWAELGEIVTGMKHGRESQEEITVFDSTGLAIQDAVTAKLVYKKAIDQKIGQFIAI